MGGRLLTGPAAGMMSAGDDSPPGTCTARRPENMTCIVTSHELKPLERGIISYPLFQINIDKWRALRGEPLLTGQGGPHLSLDISY